ncbi:peptidoglycan DD-metalloendopeptidase family protein [Thiolapillus sp.]
MSADDKMLVGEERLDRMRYTGILIRGLLIGSVLLLMTAVVGGCASQGTSVGYKQQSKPRPSVKRPGGTYRVRKGDSLYSIAWRAGLDYQTVARWNNLRSPYTIYPGQTIRLSPPKLSRKPHVAAEKTPKKTTPPPASNKKPVLKTKPKNAPKPVAKSTKTRKAPPVSSGKLQWRWPTKGKILSRYSSADASRSGIKIAGKPGQKVLAAEAGEVVYVGSGLIGYGQLIIIKHNNKYLSAYGHNSNLLVKEGDVVKRGQHISNMGITNQGKALLYFEVRRYGKPVDPLAYLPRG